MLRQHFAVGDEAELEDHWYRESSFWEQCQAGYRITQQNNRYTPDMLDDLEIALLSMGAGSRRQILAYYKRRTNRRPIAAMRELVVLLDKKHVL